MKKLLLLLLALSTLTGCDKEEDEEVVKKEEPAPTPTYPSTYLIEYKKNVTPIKMYTRLGEVKNDALIKSFVKRHASIYGYYQTNVTEKTSNSSTLVFNSATELYASNARDGEYYDIKTLEDGDIVLTSRREWEALRTKSGNTFSDFVETISKVKTIVKDPQPAPYSPGGTVYKTREQVVGTFAGNELLIHSTIITWKHTYEYGTIIYPGTYNIKFDPAGISGMGEKDTLLIQGTAVFGARQ
ncbi:hypothetical protein [Nibribacter koreensis]|uniref:Lipoprotein n=1 Tax=Nibribacter koreensis TaxID=1084519 RepID=A0ABP8F524_9BACT